MKVKKGGLLYRSKGRPPEDFPVIYERGRRSHGFQQFSVSFFISAYCFDSIFLHATEDEKYNFVTRKLIFLCLGRT